MTDINHVVLIGRLTKSVSEDERGFGYVGQTAKAVVSIAVNRSVKKGDNWEDYANYFTVEIWGKTAENLKPYLVKGQMIAVDGYLKQDRWEKDGKKYDRIIINADSVELCGGKKDGGTASASSAPVSSATQQQGFDPADGFPEDCPF